MKTLAIVVTHNRKRLLLQCLDALTRQTVPCDILVVDNASDDGTDVVVGERISGRLAYVNTGANLGDAGGFAFGIREAVDRGCETIWIMDDDQRIELVAHVRDIRVTDFHPGIFPAPPRP